MMGLYLLLSVLLLICCLLSYLLFQKQGKIAEEQSHIKTLELSLKHSEQSLTDKSEELLRLHQAYEQSQLSLKNEEIAYRLLEQEKIRLQTELKQSQEDKQNLTEQLAERFKTITTQILEERSELLHKRNEASLTPLREDLKRFGEQVQNAYQSEARERHSLQAEIRLLVEQSNRISSDANNLTQALKGENKLQGNWGEMILEDLLQNSGLERGRHYETQAKFGGETEGEKLIPDVVIKYPNGGRMIIDSKVNLKAYMEYIAAESQEDKQHYAKQHLEAVRKQIKNLHSKHYGHRVAGAPDFVIMFIPNEPAYLLALHQAPSLWQEAYDQKVLVMNATNLMAALKLAEELWRREQQQLNIEEIFTKVGDLYDKFCLYVERLEHTALQLQKAQDSLDETRKTLSEGRGNVLRRFEELKKMGAKTKKKLSQVVEKSSMLNLDDEQDGLVP